MPSTILISEIITIGFVMRFAFCLPLIIFRAMNNSVFNLLHLTSKVRILNRSGENSFGMKSLSVVLLSFAFIACSSEVSSDMPVNTGNGPEAEDTTVIKEVPLYCNADVKVGAARISAYIDLL